MDKKKIAAAVEKAIEACASDCGCSAPIPGEPQVKLNQSVLVFTVLPYVVGRVVHQDERYIYLDHASWIPDLGRFHKAMSEGTEALVEVEPYPEDRVVRLAHTAIVAVSDWPFALPGVVK